MSEPPHLDTPKKKRWQRVDGVFLLDKPQGMTSNGALQVVRRMFSAAKAGHTGTLDPMATGLLPLCFGEATKFSADLLDADKTYEAEVLFGITTDTGDAEGMVTHRCAPSFGPADLDAALTRFTGRITQIPPMHSALKKDGKPLYQLARQGIEVVREAREVTIHDLRLLEFSGEKCRLRVTCSKGTYIRTLAEDIGAALSCGAHLTALRRVAVGGLQIAQAVALEKVESTAEDQRAAYLLPPDSLLQSLPALTLEAPDVQRFSHGNPAAVNAGFSGKCRVYGDAGLLGVGEADALGTVHPKRLVATTVTD